VISRILALASSVAADALRRKVLYVVLFFVLVMAVAVPSLPSYGAGVDEAVYREVTLALVFVAALIVTLALTASRVPGEVERRTVYNVLAKNVYRWEYLVGIWAGVVFTMAWIVAAFTVIAQVVGLAQYGDPMWVLWQGTLGILLEVGVVAAVCVAASARLSAVPVVLVVLVLLFAGHSRSSLVMDDASLAWLLYPSLDTFNLINPVAHGGGVDVAYVASMLLVFVAYSAFALLLAGLLFRGRDL
jgi:ABC-type transport system involved in multi-copper enzyme maturation permease subunit